MSKISNKRTFNTLHKNTSSLWNKRYKIAFGVAIALISLMALGAFVRSGMKEVGDKAKETIDETLMGKHSIHHLQQVERDLYDLLEKEKEYTDKFLNP